MQYIDNKALQKGTIMLSDHTTTIDLVRSPREQALFPEEESEQMPDMDEFLELALEAPAPLDPYEIPTTTQEWTMPDLG
jgi:hypothetical protein